jgi:CrcB protein
MIFAVMFGGALGALCRYGVAVWWRLISTDTSAAFFPLSTLLVNVVGSFLLAFFLATSLPLDIRLKTAITTGFISSLTTFSTFETDLDSLLVGGRWLWALLYLLANLVLAFAAVMLGKALAGRWA